MPYSFVFAVKALGIDAVEVAHSSGEVAIWRFQKQVVMVAHHAVGMGRPVEPFTDLFKHFEKEFAITIVQTNIFLPVAARGDMVERTGKFDSQRP